MSSKKGEAEDSENNGHQSKVISFWSKLGNVGVLSSTDEHFIEALKVWAKANGYRIEQSLNESGFSLRDTFVSVGAHQAFGERDVADRNVIMPSPFLFNCFAAVLAQKRRL